MAIPKNITGSAITMAPAAMTPQFIFSNTMKFKTPIGAVCTFCRVSSSANKNSFHEKMNDKIAVEAMPGVAKGIEILNRVW